MEALPHFPYSPNAFNKQLLLFEESKAICPCCERARGYSYLLIPYGTSQIKNLCPWCIADGKASEKFDASFVQDIDRKQPTSDEAQTAVYCQTPGYVSWQGEFWLGHCNDLCAFIGYVGYKEVANLWEEVRADVTNEGWDEEHVKESLNKEGSMVGYLFQCRHCGKHRLSVDCD